MRSQDRDSSLYRDPPDVNSDPDTLDNLGGRLPKERHIMGIGFSIFLLAVGAILTFAVDATVAGIDIKVVGAILMAAGVIGLILTLVVFSPRRRRTVTETRQDRVAEPTAGTSTVTTDDATSPPVV